LHHYLLKRQHVHRKRLYKLQRIQQQQRRRGYRICSLLRCYLQLLTAQYLLKKGCLPVRTGPFYIYKKHLLMPFSLKTFLNPLYDKDNTIVATVQFFKLLGVKATTAEIEKRLLWSPSYPGIYSVQALLKQWRIDSMTLEVEPGRLDELPQVFLCHTHINGGQFKTVVAHNGTHVTTLNNYGRHELFTVANFNKIWSGTVLLAENDGQGGMPGYREARRNQWWTRMAAPLVLLFLLAASIFIYTAAPNNTAGALAVRGVFQLLNIAGLTLSLILLAYQLNSRSSMARQLCGLGGGEKSCDAVLQSAASKIWGISLAEWGFGWFAALALFTVFSPGLQWAGWLSLAAAAFIPFSLYYQRFVVRQWCGICLMALAVLAMQALVSVLFLKPFAAAVAPVQMLIYCVCFLIPWVIWMGIKPLAARQAALAMAEQDYFRLKHDPAIFAHLQQREAVYQVTDAGGVLLNHVPKPTSRWNNWQPCTPRYGSGLFLPPAPTRPMLPTSR
jgi:uncharacterized membrane protein